MPTPKNYILLDYKVVQTEKGSGVIPVETPWHFTTPLDALDHWQSLAAGFVALVAALIAIFGAEFFARCKERREIQALRASLAGEIRLYFDLLTETRQILTIRKEEFHSGEQPQRRIRELVLQPPIAYPVAADKLGLVRRPRAADVVNFYAMIERVNFAVRTMSNEPAEKISLSDYSVLIGLIELACRASLRLLSQLPFDERDAEFRAKIAKWDAERPRERAAT
jgi:hypothetical protein